MTVPWSPIPCESTDIGEQLVGLIVKFGLSMFTWIERIRIGMPPMIVRDRVGSRVDLGGQWIDVEGDPNDHHAVVVGTGKRRGDRGQTERRPVEWAGQVHLADRMEGVAAGTGRHVRGADLG